MPLAAFDLIAIAPKADPSYGKGPVAPNDRALSISGLFCSVQSWSDFISWSSTGMDVML